MTRYTACECYLQSVHLFKKKKQHKKTLNKIVDLTCLCEREKVPYKQSVNRLLFL